MQTEKSCKTTKIKRESISQVNSVTNSNRNKKRHIARSRGTKGKSVAYVNFLTTNSLKDIKSLRLDYLNQAGLFQDGVSPIDLIKEYYPIMKDDISIFLHTKSFNENTDPIDFLDWMFRCYEEIHSEAVWSMEEEGIKRLYDYNIAEEGHSVGIDFYPMIKEENPMLYDLMVGILGLLYRQFQVPCFWNADFDCTEEMVEQELEEMLEIKGKDKDKDSIKRYKHYIEEYTKGNHKMVENDIKEKTFNMKLYNLFRPKNSKEKTCKVFIDWSLKLLAKYPETKFWDFYHATEDEFNDGSPVMPSDYCAIGWRYDDDEDPFSYHDSQNTQMMWENYGTIPFRHVEMNNEDKEQSCFPYDWIYALEYLQEVARLY